MILAPLFVAAYVGVLVAVTVVAEAISGDQSQTVAVLVATAAVAFAFRPVQRVVAGWVDRRFFPSRRMADETVARFTDRVRQEADPVIVRDELLAVVHETLRPGARRRVGRWRKRCADGRSPLGIGDARRGPRRVRRRPRRGHRGVRLRRRADVVGGVDRRFSPGVLLRPGPLPPVAGRRRPPSRTSG